MLEEPNRDVSRKCFLYGRKDITITAYMYGTVPVYGISKIIANVVWLYGPFYFGFFMYVLAGYVIANRGEVRQKYLNSLDDTKDS